MRLFLFGSFCGVLVACGAALVPPPSRALCYAMADLRAQARVDRECAGAPDAGGVDLSACPARDDIMSELQRAQEACK